MVEFFIMLKNVLIFIALAILLSNAMCATVAYAYRDMLCGIAHGGYSAPASVSLLYAIPFILGIALCIVLSVHFSRGRRN